MDLWASHEPLGEGVGSSGPQGRFFSALAVTSPPWGRVRLKNGSFKPRIRVIGAVFAPNFPGKQCAACAALILCMNLEVDSLCEVESLGNSGLGLNSGIPRSPNPVRSGTGTFTL